MLRVHADRREPIELAFVAGHILGPHGVEDAQLLVDAKGGKLVCCLFGTGHLREAGLKACKKLFAHKRCAVRTCPRPTTASPSRRTAASG